MRSFDALKIFHLRTSFYILLQFLYPVNVRSLFTRQMPAVWCLSKESQLRDCADRCLIVQSVSTATSALWIYLRLLFVLSSSFSINCLPIFFDINLHNRKFTKFLALSLFKIFVRNVISFSQRMYGLLFSQLSYINQQTISHLIKFQRSHTLIKDVYSRYFETH